MALHTAPRRTRSARPARRSAPSMTERQLQAYFLARETLRRLASSKPAGCPASSSFPTPSD